MSKALVKNYMDGLIQSLPQEDQTLVMQDLQELRDNQLQSLPMICEASECIFAKTCPLQKRNIAPRGKPCPVEMMLIDEWTMLYAASLAIDTQDFVEVSMLADIVEAEVYDRRTQGDISMNSLFDNQAVAVDKNGDPIMRKEPAAALAVNLMMKKRKDDIRRMFLATRESRAKYKKIDSEDITTQLSRIRDEMERQAKKLPPVGDVLDVKIDTEEGRKYLPIPEGVEPGLAD